MSQLMLYACNVPNVCKIIKPFPSGFFASFSEESSVETFHMKMSLILNMQVKSVLIWMLRTKTHFDPGYRKVGNNGKSNEWRKKQSYHVLPWSLKRQFRKGKQFERSLKQPQDWSVFELVPVLDSCITRHIYCYQVYYNSEIWRHR